MTLPDETHHELSELRAVVTALRAQIENQAQRDLAGMTQAAIARERDFAQRETELNAKLLQAMNQAHAAKFDAGQLHERLIHAEGANRALTAQAVEIGGRLQQQAAQIGELLGIENGLRAQVAGQTQTIEQYAAQAVGLVGQVGALEQRIQEMVLQARAWEEKNHALSVRMEGAAEIQKSLEAALAVMEDANKRMVAQIGTLSEENRRLTGDRDTQTAVIEQQQSLAFTQSEQIKRLEQQQAVLTAARDSLQQELHGLHTQLVLLEQQHQQGLNDERAAQEQHRADLDGALEAARARLKELSEARSRRLLIKLGLVHRCSWESA